MEHIRGMTVKDSALEVLTYFEIRECVDFLIETLSLPADAFKGVTIRSLEKNRTTAGTYSSLKSLVTLYRSTNYKSKMYRKGILIHELMHALQHRKNGIACTVYNKDFQAINSNYARTKDGKYFSQPSELEAFAIQYHYLSKHGVETLSLYYVESYAKLGISLPQVAESIYGR